MGEASKHDQASASAKDLRSRLVDAHETSHFIDQVRTRDQGGTKHPPTHAVIARRQSRRGNPAPPSDFSAAVASPTPEERPACVDPVRFASRASLDPAVRAEAGEFGHIVRSIAAAQVLPANVSNAAIAAVALGSRYVR
ncbi:hypothetical protein [Candidatus Accumulibacter sp. ACC003]|uniref:hypothetical protein n=1 Tax=Candidatus Accumulibacter sp. ACC003 TaxID=2823334 RepID=UPI0025C53451|nr:hypothetical protein [Candidatus Accumulibacter sp. ACC003]